MMRRIFFVAGIWVTLLAQVACKGVKNMSGTLSKSGSGRQQPDANRDGHVDYTKVQAGTGSTHTDTATEPSPRNLEKQNEPDRVSSTSSYRRDYSRLASGENAPSASEPTLYQNAEVNEKMIRQYAEMDRLAELVVYELNILERRWDQTLTKFKTATANEREKLSMELDKLGADQLKLYKAHVRIYKDGKTDWLLTKKDVEDVLLNVRGLSTK